MITEIKDKLVSQGINPSFHRIKIYEFLLNNRIHPSVDTIYTELVKEIPSLSKTTVYNTLKYFNEKGLVLSITINENELRYDGYTHSHAHFLCTSCGALLDIDMPEDALNLRDIQTPHKITETHVYFRGICESCRNE